MIRKNFINSPQFDEVRVMVVTLWAASLAKEKWYSIELELAYSMEKVS